MLPGFKTELRGNNKQRIMLAKHAGVARHAYNCALGLLKDLLKHNREHPEDKIKFPSAIDLHKWLVAHVKSVCSWYYEVSKYAPQQALRNLRKAFDEFFKKRCDPGRGTRPKERAPREHKLAKAVQDMGFYEFRRQLEYKCQLYRCELIIADRWFPSSKTCSNCATIKESLSLSEPTFICDECGWILDRDLNAAIYWAALAVSSTVSACGVDDADISTLKTGTELRHFR